jgi:hypothetical protein
MKVKITAKDMSHLIRNASKISRDTTENGYSEITMPSGKIYKIRELG